MTIQSKIKTIVKNIVKPTQLNMLLLLSLIIIIILIYLKNKKLELFTSFIDNYLNTQKLNNNIQSIMIEHTNNINNFGSHVQQILSGEDIGTIPEPTTSKLILYDEIPINTMTYVPTTTQAPRTTRAPRPTRAPRTTMAPTTTQAPTTTTGTPTTETS